MSMSAAIQRAKNDTSSPQAPTPKNRLALFPDDLAALPEGSVIDGSKVAQNLSDSADYVIIGSGAAGATAALVLSAAGYSVILLEEGPWIRTRDFGVDVYPAMKTLFRDMGANATVGKAMLPVLQGKCVGGSTTINSAIAWRAPEHVIHRWGTHFGLKDTINNQVLEKHFDLLDRELSVRAVDEKIMGRQNDIFSAAADTLKIKAERIQRYDSGCDASASCLTGCRTAKKQSMNVTYIPKALHQGAKLYTSARAVKVDTYYGRASSVEVQFIADKTSLRAYTLHAVARRGVIVAASTIQTPGILKRSGVKLNAVGKFFQGHPGSTLPAKFDRPINMERGATQGFNSMHFVDTDRFKLETLSLPPEMLALRIPGVGPEWMKNVLDYEYILNWAVVVRAEAQGQVHPLGTSDVVAYTPTPTDMARMRRGMRVLSEMMFAAGAKEVMPSVHGVPTLKSPDDLKFWDDAPLDPRAYGMMMNHLFGAARMGKDPRNTVVGLDFQVHGVQGLYVLDSSIFPTNIGVNPQHTIMAVAHLGASQIAERPLAARTYPRA